MTKHLPSLEVSSHRSDVEEETIVFETAAEEHTTASRTVSVGDGNEDDLERDDDDTNSGTRLEKDQRELSWDEEALSWVQFQELDETSKGIDGSDCKNNSVVHEYNEDNTSVVVSLSNATDSKTRDNEREASCASEFGFDAATNDWHRGPGYRVSIVEDNRGDMYPRDSYSFLALNGPTASQWSLQKFFFFVFGLIPFVFQMAFLELLLSYLLEFKGCGEEDEKPDLLGVKPDCIRYNDESQFGGKHKNAQVMSLLVYMVFPNSTLRDVIKAIQLFPWRSAGADGVPVECIRISCILKGIQGNYALAVVFLLVMSCDNTLDIILNFTAVNFISDLDNVAFSYALSGAFGPGLQKEALRIAGTKLPACMHRKRQHVWHGTIVLITAVILFASMTYLMLVQQTNYTWITHALWAQCALGCSTLLIPIVRFLLCSYPSCTLMRFSRNLRERFSPR